ncbi:DNA mismatch repair protein MutS [Nonlabens mediterrranea]|uniref:DNA mismatch repair protein MutS n=1 Tax=Nonlabens mediterrranea TaxID=1419947 RepID=A0ABS0A3W0_9FLAO|nr:DNA mismatch repair protein MutS [Nonlabens mediterrranea]
MKETLQSFYKERIAQFKEKRDSIKDQLRVSSTIRLLIFIAGAAGVYFLWSQWQVAIIIAVSTFILFLFLVSRHENLRRKRDFQQALLDRNELELMMLDRNYTGRPDGSEYLKDDHEFSRDIDLLGPGSFFQYLNRSVTKDGVATLANQFLSNDIFDITRKQEAIKELSEKIDFRHNYGATATLLNNEKDPKDMLDWINSYTSFVPPLFSWLPWIWFIASIALGVAYFNDWINGYIFSIAFFGGLGITGKYIKRITAFSANISSLELFFKQYSQLILAIEKESFKSDLLIGLKSRIMVGDVPASIRFKELAVAIGRLDQRNNMLFGVLANGFGLWDLKQVHTIEIWLETNAIHIENWLDTVAQIDALNSLGNFAYNHKDYVYPIIETGDFKMQVSNARHPLLDPAKAIGNDIQISSGEFFIITGANMAGKSTFLRTVSMKIVMANAGLPVCAQSMIYSPIKLITSMRTSDSLTDDESYFFSELKRLKYIVDKIETERYFIVLDEILKGTNSQDKANGSRKLIEKLSRKHATGIIATHDLSLTEVANEYDSISNYFFDADITNDELTFDYTFKDGIATNMNASFLLRKMGIVDD